MLWLSPIALCGKVNIATTRRSLSWIFQVQYKFSGTYDPIAHVVGFPPSEAFAERQARLLTDLQKRYAAQVTELLNREEFAEVIS